MESDIVSMLFAIILFIFIFLILRGINLWYFRINTIVANQERNNELLRELVKNFNPNYTESRQNLELEVEPHKPNRERPTNDSLIFGSKKNDFIKGKKVALTGNFPVRMETIKKQLMSEGAVCQQSVDVDSDYLITGSNPIHGDIQAAKANNITIMTFQEYVDLTHS